MPDILSKIADFEKEMRLSHFTFEHLHEAIFWIDSQSQIFQVNEMASQLTGFSKTELLQKKITDLHLSDSIRNFPVFWERIKNNKRICLETKLIHTSGHQFAAEINYNFTSCNSEEYVCCIIWDISKKGMADKLLRVVSEATSGFTGSDFFVQLARHITITLSMRYALITECANEEKTRLRTLCYLDGQVVLDNIEYDTTGIPCEIIMKGEDFFMAKGVEAYFPKEKGIESYVGVPIFSPVNGEVMGHIIAVDPHPVNSENNQTAVLKIFASRAGAELERMRTEKQLECRNMELQERLNEIELYHTTLKNLKDQIFWINKKGNFIRVNDAVSKVTGYGLDELMTMTVFDLNPTFTKKEWNKRWEETSKLGQQLIETFHTDKVGKEYPVEVTNNFIQHAGDEYFCSSVRDIRKRKMEEELLRTVSEHTASITGENYFLELAKVVTAVLNVRYAMVNKFAGVEKTRLRMLAYVERQEILEVYEYDTKGTPCELVMQGKEYFCANNLEISYPRERGISSWVSVPIFSTTTGLPIGNIGAFDTVPMTSEQNQTSILRIFAARAGAEMERLDAQGALEKANIELAKRLLEIEQLKNQLQAENKYLQEEIKLNNNFEEIVSRSKNFHKVLEQIEQVASANTTVLITGESGTGKELIARAVHNISSRSKRPLVKVNCATLPANLIESELFGHEKGAFTGAMERKIGRFELADKGTIFLDELGELPVELQAKLLRVLQEGEFERLGNPKTIKVDVRVIAATNRRLEDAIAKKEFREDLYYRLNVFPIYSPPLRERKDDIPLLVKHFCQKHEARVGKKITGVVSKVMEVLMEYNWPGNIRELENVIERAMIICKGNTLEFGDWLPMSKPAAVESAGKSTSVKLEEVEKVHIIQVLQSVNWKVSGDKGAAKILGLNATTLEARMKKLGISRQTQTVV
ncbi:MAG: sigma 54-interacting transcriptional regulator [Ferruginibacter sp.]